MDRGDASLSQGFEFNPDLQLFDAMFRHPKQGLRLVHHDAGAPLESPVLIRGANALARREMAELRADPVEGIVLTTTRGVSYAFRDTWSLQHPVEGRRAADMPDHIEAWRMRPLRPDLARDSVGEALDRPASPVADVVASLRRSSQVAGLREIREVAHGEGRLVAWDGERGDPASRWCVMALDRDADALPDLPAEVMRCLRGQARSPAGSTTHAMTGHGQGFDRVHEQLRPMQ